MKKTGCAKTRVLAFSGHANNGANAGSFVVNSNNAPSNTNANYSSHLCLIIIMFLQTLPRWQKITITKTALVFRGVLKKKKTFPKSKLMKRIGNIYKNIISVENLDLADKKARKGKSKTYGVRVHDRHRKKNIQKLHEELKSLNFRTSEYETFTIHKPKKRLIYRLPYFPDRIVHHAIMNKIEKVFVQNFTTDTYSCIKGRGIHLCTEKVKKALRKDGAGTKYCLKLDIRKFYPSVDHDVLKKLLRRKIKDKNLLWLLDEIINSASGVPIGNYLSQYFANFYLSYFDHWLKEEKQVKYYFRYADDMVILGDNKPDLHCLLADIRKYLEENLKLKIKKNYQIFPVESRGIDFVGYVFYHTHTLLRKSIKKNFARSMRKDPSRETLAAYWGWAKHSNTNHFLKKLYYENQQY